MHTKPQQANGNDYTASPIAVFAYLTDEERKEVNEKKGCSHYKKGDVIFREGNFPFGIFTINKGKIKISKKEIDGMEQIVRLSKSGDIIGYRSLLCGEQYLCSATALEDTYACFIPRSLFQTLIQNNARLSAEIMKLLANDLGEAEKAIANQSHKNVRERMAESLLHLIQIYGFEQDGSTINVSLTREEIASIAGTGRESATKFLAEFKHDGIIEFLLKKIIVLDQNKLKHVANQQE